MCHYTSRAAALALLVGALACSTATRHRTGCRRQAEILSTCRRRALGALPRARARRSAFRAHVKGELDRSPFREHKLSFQRFLARARGAGRPRRHARQSGVATADLPRRDRAIPLEMYCPFRPTAELDR